MCNESGEVFNISTESTYTFLMADDTYEPDFAEYIGLSIKQAMQLEINEIAEQVAGAEVTTSFEIKAVSLNSIKDFVIEGVKISPIKVCLMGQNSYTFLYNGDIIAKNQGGNLLGVVISIDAFDNGGYINKTFAELSSILQTAAPVSQMHDENSNHYDGILEDNVPENATFVLVDTPRMTA